MWKVYAAPITLMLAKSLPVLAALSLLACSNEPETAHCTASGLPISGIVETGGLGGDTGDHALIVPQGMAVTPRPGINSVFNVTALTLRAGPNGAELYAAVRNDGQVIACNPSFSVELRDKDDQTIGTGVSGLITRSFYLFKDGSGTIAGCAAPGEGTMVAILRLPLDAPIENVVNVVYQSNYWANLELTALDGVSLTGVEAVARSTGVAYTGALVNGLGTTLTGPTVAVFPVNSVGRPLGVAYGSSPALVLEPCGTWHFETSAISEPGVGYDAYPMGG